MNLFSHTKSAWFRSFYISLLSVVGFAALAVFCGSMFNHVFSDETTVHRTLAGDADADGLVDLSDAVLTAKAGAGLSTLTVVGKLNVDIDRNGRIDSFDLAQILMYLADASHDLDPERHSTDTGATETTTGTTASTQQSITDTTSSIMSGETTLSTESASSESATTTTSSSSTASSTASSTSSSSTAISSSTAETVIQTGTGEHLVVENKQMPLGLSSGELIANLGSPTEEVVVGYQACDMKFFIYNQDPAHLHIAIVADDTVVGYYAVGTIYEAPEGYSTVEYIDKHSEGTGEIFALFSMKTGYSINMLKILDKTELSVMAKLNWYAVNAVRAMHDLPAFNWNPVLASVAAGHSRDMAEHDEFSHKGSDGSMPRDRIIASGLNTTARGENIDCGYSDPFTALYGWYTSETGHRKNLLCEISVDEDGNPMPVFTDIGIAFAYNEDSAYKFFGTQDFAAVKQ